MHSNETHEFFAALKGVQLAQANPAAAIGDVSSLLGAVTVIGADGKSRSLEPGDTIYQDDRVSTKAGGQLSVTFLDGTVFVMEENSEMVLDQVIYDPGAAGNSFVTTLVKGLFVFATGEIAGEGEMIVKTPSGSIGIRGTTVGVVIDAASGLVRITNLKNPITGEIGQFSFVNDGGETVFGAENDSLEVRDGFSPHGGLFHSDPAAIEGFYGGALNSLGATQRLQRGGLEDDPAFGEATDARLSDDGAGDQPLSSGSGAAARMEASEETLAGETDDGSLEESGDFTLATLVGDEEAIYFEGELLESASGPTATTAIAPLDFIWTGFAGDQSWQTPGNWDFGVTPTAGSQVLLDNPFDIVTYFPADPNSQLLLDDLDLQNGATLRHLAGQLGTADWFSIAATSNMAIQGGDFGIVSGNGVNWGNLLVDSGTLSVSNGQFVNAGNMEVRSTGRLEVFGGQFDNQGDIAVSGLVDFGGGWRFDNFGVFTTAVGVGAAVLDGDFQQFNGGQFLVEMTAGGHDMLTVTGRVDLAGDLNVAPSAGFVANPGDTYSVLQASQVFGFFNNGQIVSFLGPNLVLKVSYTPTSVDLIASNQTTAGDDQIFGTAQPDWLQGFDGDDAIHGGDGDDWINGDQGFDFIDGGPGKDVLSFASSPSGVIANLSGSTQFGVGPQQASDGFGSTDSVTGMEILDGSGFDDILIGDVGDNLLDGQFGADLLIGGGGSDAFTLRAGDGGMVISLADVVTDFQDGVDQLGLQSGLTLADLTIGADGAGNAVVGVAASGEFLMVLQGVGPAALDPGDFFVL